MSRFRIKFTLIDGRKVYPTDSGGYQYVPPNALASTTVRDMIAYGAYSSCLSMFVMGASGKPDFVGISHAELESEHDPHDDSAFGPGGRKPF